MLRNGRAGDRQRGGALRASGDLGAQLLQAWRRPQQWGAVPRGFTLIERLVAIERDGVDRHPESWARAPVGA